MHAIVAALRDSKRRQASAAEGQQSNETTGNLGGLYGDLELSYVTFARKGLHMHESQPDNIKIDCQLGIHNLVNHAFWNQEFWDMCLGPS